MRTFNFLTICGLILITLTGLMNHLEAQSIRTDDQDIQPLDLKEGSRITFVGNSLFEQAQPYGILEFMLLSAWPDKRLTFRNLGWSGDTAEGSARSYISTPPQPYDLLIQQILATAPDVVVIAYGSMEAYEGLNGLKKFEDNLIRLIDTIHSMEAQPVLVTPIPQIPIEKINVNVKERNDNLALYTQKIKEIAHKKDLLVADLFNNFQQIGQTAYTENGIHLNESGYYQAGKMLLSSLGHKDPVWNIDVNSKTNEINASGDLKITDPGINRKGLEFTVHDKHLPHPGHIKTQSGRTLVIQGLHKGVYTLLVDQQNIVSATAKAWANGVQITQGPAFDKARQIREKLIQINDLYFQAYRPLNRTYLVGMRLHEQEQNAYELEVNNLFINRLEDQIALLLNQDSNHYQLKRIK